MSTRSSIRFIAKERLHEMGFKHVNKSFGLGVSHTTNHNRQRTYTGRKLMEKIRGSRKPMWRRVIFGNLAKKGLNAQIGNKRLTTN